MGRSCKCQTRYTANTHMLLLAGLLLLACSVTDGSRLDRRPHHNALFSSSSADNGRQPFAKGRASIAGRIRLNNQLTPAPSTSKVAADISAAARAAAAAAAGGIKPTATAGAATKQTTRTGVTAAAAASTNNFSPVGRSLKQIANDPYGYGYYDPYVAGVTPGFVNLDLNRETGLHLGVGDAVVDVSADKNYVGFGLGQGLGFGKAKDRGWNLQLGGGNILDVSVTKDAGLGLWVLDGLVNVQIGPDGREQDRSRLAAQSVSTAAAPAPADIQTVVVDDVTTAASNPADAVQVVVDDSVYNPTYTSGLDPTVEHNPPYPVYAFGGPDVVVSPTSTYSADVTVTEHNPAQAQFDASNAVEVTPVQDYQGTAGPNPDAEATLPSYDFLQNLDYDGVPTYQTQQAPASVANPVYMIPRPVTEDNAVWSTASQYSDTADMGARLRAAAPSVAPAAAAVVMPGAVPTAAVPQTSATAPRRACQGGEMVWSAGNKFKCRYRKATAVQAVPTQYTYANGVAVR